MSSIIIIIIITIISYILYKKYNNQKIIVKTRNPRDKPLFDLIINTLENDSKSFMENIPGLIFYRIRELISNKYNFKINIYTDDGRFLLRTTPSLNLTFKEKNQLRKSCRICVRNMIKIKSDIEEAEENIIKDNILEVKKWHQK